MGRVVHFKLEGEAESLGVAPRGAERASFCRNDVEVTLEMEVTDRGNETGNCLVVAHTSREVSEEIYGLLNKELEAILVEPAKPQPQTTGMITFTTLSEREVRWMLHPPQALVRLCEDVYTELHAEAARLVRILRWLFNRPWPAQPLHRSELLWSLESKQWNEAPKRLIDVPSFGGGDDVELSQSQVVLVTRLWESGEFAEPLARQILLEAASLADENRRAAFILAFVAAEVGVKQFGSNQSASLSEAWLLETLQSPPLDRLLREYLVPLTEKKTVSGHAVPPELATLFEKAMKTRNHLMHRGQEPPPSEETVARLLAGVNDLLYLLDWFAGHDWAFERLSDDTRAAYKG